MATISAPKTLNDIEALPENASATILVLDSNSKLKKVELIDAEGNINSLLTAKIAQAVSDLKKNVSKHADKSETLHNILNEIKARVDAFEASKDEQIAKIEAEIKAIKASISEMAKAAQRTADKAETAEAIEAPAEKKTTKRSKKTVSAE